jgi:hypothetical protein
MPEPAPAPAPDQPAPMKIDGPAQAGTDAFGLSSGKGGGMGGGGSNGTCLVPPCGGGGGGGFSNSIYNRYLSSAFLDFIKQNDKIRRQVFTTTVAVWITNTGRIFKVEVVKSSGNSKNDQLIKDSLLNRGGLDPAPASVKFPQQVVVRLTPGI